jgi:predicted Fe-S protein YdhL (DUF1289 family)
MSLPIVAASVRGPVSPCIKVCALDAQGICVGCLRTLDEIAKWSSMSASEQWKVVAAIDARRKRGASEAGDSGDAST